MYVFEISIEIKDHNLEEIYDDFTSLISCYWKNGQIHEDRIDYIKNNKIVMVVNTLERDSLSKDYNNYYVNNRIDKIQEKWNSKIEFQFLGEMPYDKLLIENVCSCSKSEFHILYTDAYSLGSPIKCGNCFGTIPLYKFPKYNEHSYQEVLWWEQDYKACDRLQIGCSVGEKWALNQMQEVNSQLTKVGLKICRKMEELTNIPTYYFLYDYRKIKKNAAIKKCPSCKKEWLLETPLHKLFDFKCDSCKLLSQNSFNSS